MKRRSEYQIEKSASELSDCPELEFSKGLSSNRLIHEFRIVGYKDCAWISKSSVVVGKQLCGKELNLPNYQIPLRWILLQTRPCENKLV